MIEAAENVAQTYHISRERQDEFAYRSHQLTNEHINNGNISEKYFLLKLKVLGLIETKVLNHDLL